MNTKFYFIVRSHIYVPFKAIFLLILLTVLHNSCDTVNKVNEEHIAFEFSDEVPSLMIPVTLQDSISANLVFDTGCSLLILDSTFAAQYPSLTPKDNLLLEEYGFSSAWNPASFTKSLLYSDSITNTLNLKLSDHPMNYDYWHVGNFRTTFGVNKVDGLFGISSADSTRVWGVNFEHNYFTIQEADGFEMPKECQVFPMKVMTVYPRCLTFSVNLPLKIQTSDGDTITLHRDFLVDTGAWNDIIITSESPELAFFNTKKDAVWIPTSDGLYTKNHAVKVGIGEYEDDSFRVTTYDHKTNVKHRYLIGMNFLKHFNVYFDFQREVMGLKPIPNFERIIDKHARRLHLGFNQETMMKQRRFVIEIIADNKENTYYTAGLRMGDEIIFVNEILWRDITPEQKEAMYKGDSIRFKIVRNSQDMVITVPINKEEPIGY